MSILDKMGVYERPAEFKRHDDPYGPRLSLEEAPMPMQPFHNGYTFEEAFRTTLKVETMWYANQAQHRDRQKLARKEILYHVYGPVISRLHEIKARAYDRDYREVLRVVSELEKELLD